MKRKNGFTLIELLAVIVILAIIALIATPIVLNMINSARKSAAKSSSLGFIDSIEYYAGFAGANGNGMDLGDYDSELLPTTNTVCTKTNGTWTTCADLMAKVEAKSKGKAPTDAQISLDTSGKVKNTSWLKYNDYYCVYSGSDIVDGCTKTTPANAEVATDTASNISGMPTMAEMCPGCKFIYYDDVDDVLDVKSGNMPEGVTNDYTTITDHQVFLGLIESTTNSGKIGRAFVCGIKDGIPFCLEGSDGDTTKFANNVNILNKIYPNCNVDYSGGAGDINCFESSVRAFTNESTGNISIINVGNSDNERCNVDSVAVCWIYEDE